MQSESFIKSFCPKTIMMSVSGIILGSLLSAADYNISWWSVVFMLISVISLQLFSNMIPGIIAAVAAAWLSYGSLLRLETMLLLLMGYFVYRLVKSHSPQDGLYRNGIVVTLTSLLVYGLLPVYGSYFVCTHSFANWLLLFPSISIGSMCLAAVNSDYISETGTRIFHTIWLVAGFAAMIVYACLRIYDPWHFLFLLMAPAFGWLLACVWRITRCRQYDLILAVCILLFALTAGLGFTAYLF